MTTSSSDTNIEKERGGKYDTEMIVLLLHLFNSVVFLMILFADVDCKLLLLIQDLIKIFSKVTELSGDINIKKELSCKYGTGMVPFLILMFDDAIFMLFLFASDLRSEN